MGLTALPFPYFAQGSAPPLSVSWTDADVPVQIWERFSKASPSVWALRAVDKRDRSYQVDGINKGEVYEALLYRERDHPNPNQNLTDPAPQDHLKVVGLIDQHKDLISLLDGIAIGGTYVFTGVSMPKGFAMLQVGRTAPVLIPTPTASGVELRVIVNPEAEARSFGKTFHNLECQPLVPGQPYFAVIMAVDEDGFWDCQTLDLNTKKRQVDIAFKTIHVFNDGDPGGSGEAQFWVSVLEAGTAVPGTVYSSWSLGNDEYDIIDGQDIALPTSWKATIGPKEIDPQVNGIVAVHTNALEYDGVEGTEKAGSDRNDLVLRFPTGRANEEHQETGATVRGDPLEDDDFKYNVKLDWKVTYV